MIGEKICVMDCLVNNIEGKDIVSCIFVCVKINY